MDSQEKTACLLCSSEIAVKDLKSHLKKFHKVCRKPLTGQIVRCMCCLEKMLHTDMEEHVRKFHGINPFETNKRYILNFEPIIPTGNCIRNVEQHVNGSQTNSFNKTMDNSHHASSDIQNLLDEIERYRCGHCSFSNNSRALVKLHMNKNHEDEDQRKDPVKQVMKIIFKRRLMKKAIDSIQNEDGNEKQVAIKETPSSTETLRKNNFSRAGVRFKCKLCEFHSNAPAEAEFHMKSMHKHDDLIINLKRQEMFVYLEKTNLDYQWRHPVLDVEQPVNEPSQFARAREDEESEDLIAADDIEEVNYYRLMLELISYYPPF